MESALYDGAAVLSVMSTLGARTWFPHVAECVMEITHAIASRREFQGRQRPRYFRRQ